MTVPFKELAGSPIETYGSGPMKATRTLMVAWDQKENFLRELLGTFVPQGGEGVAPYPGRPSVIPVRVRVEPFTDDITEQDPVEFTDVSEQLNTYNSFALFTVEYEHVTHSWPGIEEFTLEKWTYLTHRRSGGAEAVVHRATSFRELGEDANLTDANQVFMQRIPIVEHHYAWHYVVDPPFATIEDNIGKVNDAVWHGFAKDTILFDTYSMDIEFVILDDGSRPITLWRLNYVFRERRVHLPAGGVGGWQHVFLNEPNNVGWAEVTQPNGDPLYERTGALDNLFIYLIAP